MRNKGQNGWRLVACAVVPLLFGAVAGYLLRGIMDRPVDVPAGVSEIANAPSVIVTNSHDDAKSDEVIAYLRKRIAALENALASASTARDIPEPTVVVVTNDSDRAHAKADDWRNLSPSERRKAKFERLRQEDPERYEEMKAHLADMRARMQEMTAHRQDFLASVDTSRMSAEQLANHQLLLETSAKIDSYRARRIADSKKPLTSEEHKDFAEMRHALKDLMDSERRYLLESLGTDYGEDGVLFADYIEAVFEYTSSRGTHRREKEERQ